MNANLDQIISCLRIIAEHLVNGLILSSAIFVGSVVAFRWLFRAQRWSASTLYQASLIVFLVLAVTPVATLLRSTPPQNGPRTEAALASDPGFEELPGSGGVINPTNDKGRSTTYRSQNFGFAGSTGPSLLRSPGPSSLRLACSDWPWRSIGFLFFSIARYH
jgi:hypothetical protein